MNLIYRFTTTVCLLISVLLGNSGFFIAAEDPFSNDKGQQDFALNVSWERLAVAPQTFENKKVYIEGWISVRKEPTEILLYKDAESLKYSKTQQSVALHPSKKLLQSFGGGDISKWASVSGKYARIECRLRALPKDIEGRVHVIGMLVGPFIITVVGDHDSEDVGMQTPDPDWRQAEINEEFLTWEKNILAGGVDMRGQPLSPDSANGTGSPSEKGESPNNSDSAPRQPPEGPPPAGPSSAPKK